jgi:drug/metabolite transporter (DMT)-like permease
MLWIILTAAAAPLQVARNVLQRGLVGDAGPWGATLVRFLFGLPFALAIFAVVGLLTPGADPVFSSRFAGYISLGAFAQVCATATLLLAMRQSGLGVATVMQQSSLPFSAVLGYFVYGDNLDAVGWAGLAATTAGLVILSWPKRGQGPNVLAGAMLGLGSGLAFAFTLNAYRQASLALEPDHAIYAASASVCVAQLLQSAGLTLMLALTRPAALKAVAASWRQSLGAGFFGAVASACWFAALALAPAAQVRAVGVVEMPVAAIVGRRMFKEKMTGRQMLGALLAAAGVVATALG